MTIDILICTIDEGVNDVGRVLMPPMEGVRYVVSVQYTTTATAPVLSNEWTRRSDVTLTMLPGRGLSRNRNHALASAAADIVVVADDDCRYTPESIAVIRRAYANHPEAAVICFQMADYEGRLLKDYPQTTLTYDAAHRQGYTAASVEMTFRRDSLKDLQFDERFGLGTSLPAGEEEIFVCDATRRSLTVLFVPETIVRTQGATTGRRFLQDTRLQVTKGAVFRYRYGLAEALWRTLKEGAFHFLYNHVNPFPIYYNMLRGICR